jgi:hypothetical protein
MSDKAREQMTEVFGASANVAVPLGSIVHFRREGQPERSGKLLHVIEPGETAGRKHGMLCVIDCGNGFPAYVNVGDVIL